MDSDLEEDQNDITTETPQRGRPAGKSDSTKRYRRTAQEISDDKIRIAEMRLNALREMEEQKLINKKSRIRSNKPKADVRESELPKTQKDVVRVRSESPPTPRPTNKRQALYDSWFEPRKIY